ncbi:hypothetical protein [Collimonas sp. OK242]|jgi:hypothetical protein|uniref:hypothetical protein n=1 Tax=Collimonas sp. OK242 TaxID=1798195 RepID=UPI000B84148A|nr:hypothetical protein [Collimonas sp. OK242]
MIDNQKRMESIFPLAASERQLQINDFRHELFADDLLESWRPLSYNFVSPGHLLILFSFFYVAALAH